MSQKEEFPELITPEQVADILKIKLSTVYKYLNEGKIPDIRIGSLWRIDKKELLILLKKN